MEQFGNAGIPDAKDDVPASLMWVERLQVLGYTINKGTGVGGKKCRRYPVEFCGENWYAWRCDMLFIALGV